MRGPSRVPPFVGRDREVAAFSDALDAALRESPQTVLVGGDAGIGKTALIARAAQLATERGFAVAVGNCLDVEADISVAPVVQAIRALLDTTADLEHRPSARRMRDLLDPELPINPEPFRILEDLRQTVIEAAAVGPVMLTLEDMHWADRSTQDFVVSLSRMARGRLLFVLTFRSDELHRRHPFRRALAELARAPGITRLDLDPLGRDNIVEIVAAHAGQADPLLVDVVLSRSEGNPLYAEELVDADRREVPEPLADLFLARVDALGDEVRGLLQRASISGTRVDTDTLPELSDLEPLRVETLLHHALDAHVLRQRGDSLEFWHGLLREAVYDDLLPDERTRLHGQMAAILQARADDTPDPGLSTLSRLAFHSAAAHDQPRTLSSSVRAGMVAWRLGTAEAMTHLERALSLWDRVTDAEALCGLSKIEVVLSLARAVSDQGENERWHELNRRAVDMLEPGTDPLVASRAYSALGVSAMHNHDMASAPGSIRLAIEYAGDASTAEAAHAYAAQALLHNFNNNFGAGLEAADRAIEAARAASSIDPLLLALMFRAEALIHVGRIRDAPVAANEAVEHARQAGMVGHSLHSAGWQAALLMDLGHVVQGQSIARAAYDEALAAGLPVEAAWCGESLVHALTWNGMLDSAELLLEELSRFSISDPPWRGRAELYLARGDPDEAALVMPSKAVDELGVGAYPDCFDVLRELQLAIQRVDLTRCHDVADAYLAQLDEGDSPLIAAAAARIGFQALAMGRAGPSTTAPNLSDRAGQLLATARAGFNQEARKTYFGVQLTLAEAYSSRLAGKPGVVQFREAVALAEPFGRFFALGPRVELAQELLEHGGRDEARELLVSCWRAAQDMGAQGLEQRTVRLAARTRVPLPGTAVVNEGPLSRLTPREREVLDLLANGATNRDIAQSLFITYKTASVHVSRVLAKLGVANRTAAAALARRYE